ncbi:hypothetical protein [Bradyrhizobium sacchari]|uniref:hypothetical protein n=1 Tax=Bradyrhizobium sacchari TaxID=1399419 RepID=UPI0010A965E1|nr:hypothetical protein [Bradyrhizobium sacchari]
MAALPMLYDLNPELGSARDLTMHDRAIDSDICDRIPRDSAQGIRRSPEHHVLHSAIFPQA